MDSFYLFWNLSLLTPVLVLVIISLHLRLRTGVNNVIYLLVVKVRDAIFWGLEILINYLAGNYL